MIREAIILQHKLQRALWCFKGRCPNTRNRWELLSDEIITHSDRPEVMRMVDKIIHLQHNIFGYPNEERDLWLLFEGDEMRRYYEKEKSKIVYFVGCKGSFLISYNHYALRILKGLEELKIDFAILGNKEWCCGLPLKRLGLDDAFKRCKKHNIEEVKRLKAQKVIFSCQKCYSIWKEEYRLEKIGLIYKDIRQDK